MGSFSSDITHAIRMKVLQTTLMTKKTTSSKSKPARRQRSKKTEIVAMNANTSALLPTNKRNSLVAWFNLYMGVEVGDASPNTFKAKAADLSRFAQYFTKTTGTDHPDQWTPSVSKGFVAQMLKTKSERTGKKLAPSTVNRVLATLRSAARWIHRQRNFLAGYPLEKISDVHTKEPTWKGLSDLEVTRLRSASEQLLKLNTKTNQTAKRDHAILLVLLGTALRVSEIADLDFDQYEGKYFLRVRRKGNNITERVFLPQEGREALDIYVKAVRGDKSGPIFQSKTGKRLAIQNIADALKRIAKQANAKIRKSEAIEVSPHDLRHTALRKMAEKKGIRYAQQMAGHASSHYIWRYVQPTSEDMEAAAEDLYE